MNMICRFLKGCAHAFSSLLVFFDKVVLSLLLKILKVCTWTLALLSIILLSLMLFSDWLFPSLFGSYSLGNNIYLSGQASMSVVYPSTYDMHGRTAKGGMLLIPDIRLYADSVFSSEHVRDANFDDNWIIVKTTGNTITHKRYYIIDKNFDPETLEFDEVIDNHIVGYSDSLEFASACRSKGITLKWANMIDKDTKFLLWSP